MIGAVVHTALDMYQKFENMVMIVTWLLLSTKLGFSMGLKSPFGLLDALQNSVFYIILTLPKAVWRSTTPVLKGDACSGWPAKICHKM